MEEVNLEDKAPEKTSLKGERKQITVAFSDLSGYTAMSNKLDAEEVDEIMSTLFSKASQIIEKYEGRIDKFIGDAVMYNFGFPIAHEDDPVRAIKVAIEIHEFVENLSTDFQEKIGRPLSMHSGITTGVLIAKESEFEKEKEGLLGDSINLASRLTSLAKAGEILVGKETRQLSLRHFDFEEVSPESVKGFDEKIISYKLSAVKEKPATIHRLSGLRAGLIGRDNELSILKDAAKRLEKGEGSVISVIGDAGTGKSRLIEEFRNSLDLKKYQWREGRAFSYSKNISYFLLIDLLNRAWQIRENDSKNEVKEKLESSLKQLLGNVDAVPFIGGLYSLDYDELKDINPEHWKTKLLESIKMILRALTDRSPAIIYLEDLHWADPSSIEALRSILKSENYPAIFLFTYRPTLSFLDNEENDILIGNFKEIRLKDLSGDEAQDMVASLLGSSVVPADLSNFVNKRAEGNPFYVEEVINSLIETDTLLKENGSWKLTKTLDEVKVPTTINGVISSRLDQLETGMKRIIQEASVIGRSFLFAILSKISDLKETLEGDLEGLEDLDLIRTRQLKPDLEYFFKHALTQDVAYSRLLKKERKVLHEKIANVMEEIFHDRLEEFYEILAFHYQQGQSENKAIEYLVMSGEKNLKKYSLDESHQFYKQAFQILENKKEKSESEKEQLIEILIDWAPVFFHKGDFAALENILKEKEDLAKSLKEEDSLAMLYVWIAISVHYRSCDFNDARNYLQQALNFGEKSGNQKIIAYASCWLTYVATEFGQVNEAVNYAKVACELSETMKHDHFLYYSALGSAGFANYFSGNIMATRSTGETLIEFGNQNSSGSSLAYGHLNVAFSNMLEGDHLQAIESIKKGVNIAVDPYLYHYLKMWLGISYALSGQYKEAEFPLNDVIEFEKKVEIDVMSDLAKIVLGATNISKGYFGRGVKSIKTIDKRLMKNNLAARRQLSLDTLAKVYAEFSIRSQPIKFSTIIKNIVFIAINIPIATKISEYRFKSLIKMSKDRRASTWIGYYSYLLGNLYKQKKKTAKAENEFKEAIIYLKQSDAKTFLKQSEEALASLEQ